MKSDQKITSTILTLLTAFAVSCCPAVLAQVTPAPEIPPLAQGLAVDTAEIELPKMDLKARELSAPVAVKSRLEMLRQDIRVKGLAYDVGYTSAFDHPIPKLHTGADDKDRTAATMQKHNVEAQKIINIGKLPTVEEIKGQGTQSSGDRTSPGSVGSLVVPGSCKTMRHFEYTRASGDLPPIRDQNGCGSCWAFAAAGVVDSSYRIRYGRNANVAEQELIDCAGGVLSGIVDGCDGFYIEPTMLHFQFDGVAWEQNYPYIGTDKPCHHSGFSYKISTWGWAGIGFASKNQIKDALCKYGPVATTIEVTESFSAYTGGVFSEKPRSSYGPIPTINHAVVIVGWDDDKGAWRVRNSWGNWGEDGYAWVKYDNNAIGWDTVWAIAKPPPVVPVTGELQVGQSKTVNISAKEPYDLTGVYVRNGQKFEFSTTSGAWNNGSKETTCNGYPAGFADVTRRHGDIKMMALTGEIFEQNNKDHYTGTYFKIGCDKTWTATRSGYLICFANDTLLNGYGDNSGIVTLTTKRIQ